MSKIFIYYSATGNGDAIASFLKTKGYAILKVDLIKPFGKPHFFKMFKYGRRSIAHVKEELAPYSMDLAPFDTVVIGSPVWGGHIASPMYTFLKANTFKDKTVQGIFYSMSGKAKKAPDELKSFCPGATSIVIESPLENLDEMKRQVDKVA
jgi:hypothetical protein